MMVVCDIKEPGLPLMSVDAFVMGTGNQFTVILMLPITTWKTLPREEITR
jgi:hypothetical protein